MRVFRVAAVAALVLLPAACGWVEVGTGSRPRLASAPHPSSDAAFVNASAVIVGAGDTVYTLAQRHNVPLRALIDANNLTPPYALRIGQRIVLPRGRQHVVQRGDTLSKIAGRYDVDMYQMARANGLNPPYVIYPGQRLILPGAAYLPKAEPEPAPLPPIERTTASKPVETKAAPRPNPVPEPPAAAGDGFAWPLRGKVLSGFGPKDAGLQNDGINIAAPRGAPVRAAQHGVVAYAGNELRGFGNLLLVKHAGGWVTAYAHNEELLVKRGDKVTRGQAIAHVGSSGSVNAPQLHFEVRQGKKPVDPMLYLPKASASLDVALAPWY